MEQEGRGQPLDGSDQIPGQARGRSEALGPNSLPQLGLQLGLAYLLILVVCSVSRLPPLVACVVRFPQFLPAQWHPSFRVDRLPIVPCRVQLLPVAIFAFSKKMCEECAYGMFSMDLTSNQEKSEVRVGILLCRL